MSENLFVKWTILPQEPPQPLLYCKRCGGTRNFRSSGKIRVNANGKRVDAWLVYKCMSCDGTWNRPVLERQSVRSIDPLLLASLCANDAKLADRLAFDVEGLRRWAPHLKEASNAVVARELLSETPARPLELRILCVVPCHMALRLDRLLADELRIPRSRIHALEKSGALVVFPSASRALRKPVRDGTKLLIRPPAEDADWIARSAAYGDDCP
ncbi:MAG: DUF1062 domain-containing protein [Rhizobiaceae bacterium]|nr:DUF1062 domain-containing protein [Rhizobiaceae bacterium]MCV0409093.1 DUF1062 domain-containing protein [Rhizobiaceae bacterium]